MFSALRRLLFWVDFGWGAGVTNLTFLRRMAASCIRGASLGIRLMPAAYGACVGRDSCPCRLDPQELL